MANRPDHHAADAAVAEAVRASEAAGDAVMSMYHAWQSVYLDSPFVSDGQSVLVLPMRSMACIASQATVACREAIREIAKEVAEGYVR